MQGQIIKLGGVGEVYTDAPGKVGELRSYYNDTYGYQTFRLVQNVTGATLPPYRFLDYDAGSSILAGLAAADAPKIRVPGVVQRADGIPNLYYGWVLCLGDGLVQVDAAVAADALLVVKTASAAGRVDDPAIAGLEHCIVGESKAAGAAAGENIRAFVNTL